MSIDYHPSKNDVVEPLSALKSANDTAWVILGYENDVKITVVAKSNSSIKDCLNHVSPDKLIYIVISVKLHADMPSKVAFISWSGARVKPKQKALAPSHREVLKKLAEQALGGPLATDYIVASADELNDDDLHEKLFGKAKRMRGMSVRPSAAPSLSSPRSSPAAAFNNSAAAQSIGAPKPAANLKAQLAQQLSIDQDALAQVLNDIKQTKKRWVLLQYDDAGVLKVKASGEKDSSEEYTSLLDASDLQILVIKLNMGDTLGYGSDAEKVLFATFSGPKLGSIRRGKLNQNKQQVYSFCNSKLQLSGEFETTEVKEMSDEHLRNFAAGKRGSVASSSAKAANVPPVAIAKVAANPTPAEALKSPQHSATLKARPNLMNLAAMAAVGKVKSTVNLVNNAPIVQHHKAVVQVPIKHLPLQKGDASIKVLNEEDAVEKLNKLAIEQDLSVMWCAFGYDGKNVSDLKLIESGDKRLMDSQDALKQALVDDQLKYVIFKAYCNKGGDDYRLKFAIATWKGPKIRAVYKAISANHATKLKTTVYRIIKFSHEVELSNVVDVDESKIFKQDSILSLEKVKEILEAKAAAAAATLASPAPAHHVSNAQISAPFHAAPVPKASPRASPRVSAAPVIAVGGIADAQKLTDALKDLQNDNTATNWVLVGYEAATGSLNVMNTGSGGLEEFKPLVKADQIFFIFYKFIVEETGYGATPKNMLIVWIGKEVKTIKAAQSAAHRKNLVALASKTTTVNAEYEASVPDDLNEQFIRGKITGKKGSSGYQGAAAQGSSHVAAPRSPVQFGGRSQNLKYKNEEEIKAALKDLADDATETNWVAFKYSGEELVLSAKGTDGIPGFSAVLGPSDVCYVFYKMFVNNLSYGGGPKIAYIVWVGPQCASNEKAKSSTHRIVFRDFSKGVLAVAAEIPAETADDLSESNIIGKVTGSKGRVDGESAPSISVSSAVASAAASNNNSSPIGGARRFGGKDSTLKYSEEVDVDFKLLRSNSSGIRWLMFTYDDNDSYKIRVAHKGNGGVENFKPLIDENHIWFILFRLSIIEYGDIAKCVMITWVGENVENFQKAKSSGHRYNLMDYARKHVSIGGQFDPLALDELTDDAVQHKITGSGKDAKSPNPDSPQQQVLTSFHSRGTIGAAPKSPIAVQQDANIQTLVEFNGKDEIKKALLELLEKPLELDFVKMEVSGKNMRDVAIVAKGLGCLSDEWKTEHLSPTNVYVFILAVTTSEKGYGLVTKYVSVQWIGAQVKHMLKSKANEIRWSLYKYCDDIIHLSGELPSVQLPEEVTRQAIIEKISGTRVRGAEMQIKKKDERFEGLGKDKKSQLQFANEEEISTLLGELIKENAEINWIGFCYDNNSIDVVRFDKKGSGHLEEIKQEFKPDNIYWVVHTVKHAFGYQKDLVEQFGQEDLAKPYYGLIQWQGVEIGVLQKALSSHHWNTFEKTIKKKMDGLKANIQGGHYFAEKIEELNIERIKKTMNLYD